MNDCPATFSVDHGDYGEPVDCNLPIEHNADDEPWHSGGWASDGEEFVARWRWDKEILVYRWPPPQDPFSKVWSRSYRHMAVLRGLDMTRLFRERAHWRDSCRGRDGELAQVGRFAEGNRARGDDGGAMSGAVAVLMKRGLDIDKVPRGFRR